MGQGSTFSLKLSLVIDHKEKSVELNKRTLADNHQDDLACDIPLTILVAEDNKINQIIVGKLFSKLGYKVDIVVNGLLAVKAIENKTYDMVFMDM